MSDMFSGGAIFDDRSLKIAFLQDRPGAGIRDGFMRVLRSNVPDILAFPEYYFVNSDENSVLQSLSRRDEIISRLGQWSRDLNCIIVGGSLAENDNGHNYNRSYLIDSGEVIGFYDKIHLYRNEGDGLITPGKEYKAFQAGKLKIGLMICADVLYPDSFEKMRLYRPDLIIVPTTSPYRPGETREAKFARDNEIFAGGAARANSIIIKVSASGSIIGHRLQGRSLIASPGKILWRIEPEDEDRSALVIATLSGDRQNPSLDIDVHWA